MSPFAFCDHQLPKKSICFILLVFASCVYSTLFSEDTTQTSQRQAKSIQTQKSLYLPSVSSARDDPTTWWMKNSVFSPQKRLGWRKDAGTNQLSTGNASYICCLLLPCFCSLVVDQRQKWLVFCHCPLWASAMLCHHAASWCANSAEVSIFASLEVASLQFLLSPHTGIRSKEKLRSDCSGWSCNKATTKGQKNLWQETSIIGKLCCTPRHRKPIFWTRILEDTPDGPQQVTNFHRCLWRYLRGWLTSPTAGKAPRRTVIESCSSWANEKT